MFRLAFITLLSCTFFTRVHAQISVTSAKQSGNWADYYVDEVLLGTGVTAFNATFTGCDTTYFSHQEGYDSTQIGEFVNTSSVVDIPSGLFLASGSTEQLAGYNPNPNFGPNGSDAVADPDLQLILPTFTLNNSAVLEFDFVPQGDTIRFKYVFASLEYPGYVCSQFNDVFGFFLSGPGISGPFSNNAINLAVVPGSSTPVAINTINDIPGGSACNPACPCNSQYFVNNYTAPTDTNIAFGGLTVALEAIAEVICGDTYHIKMAIADAGDGVLDSGVFLEGGSFSSNLIEVQIETVNGDSTINEGCGTADIVFTRGDTTDTSISYLTYTGTATNGVDFDLLPDTIMLLPGVQDTTITINPFADGLAEGMEYVTISALSITLCGDTFISTGTMYIYDLPQIVFDKSPDTTFTCPPDTLTLWAQALSGGPPPFTYLWSTGDTTDTITTSLSPNGGVDTFVVAVQDSCQLTTIYDTILVYKNYADDPVPNILNDTLVNCAGDAINLQCVVDFGTEPLAYLWSTGDTSSSTDVLVFGDTSFTIAVTDACGRVRYDTAYLGVKVPDSFSVAFPDTLIYCKGSFLHINPAFSGGVPPFQYAWNQSNTGYSNDSVINVAINRDTTIHLWVRDVCGREFYDSFEVLALDIDSLTANLEAQEALCAGTEFALQPGVAGGLAPLTYAWSTGETDSAIVFFGSVSQLVFVTVTDFCGTQAVASADIFIPEVSELDLILSGDNRLCYGDEYFIKALALGGAGGYTFEWFSIEDPITGESYQKIDSSTFRVIARQTNTHYVRVADQCGNATTDTLRLEVRHCISIPNVITPNGDGLNDAFYINNVTEFPDAHLFIYNRWGQKVFEAMPYRNEWVPLDHPSGTYFYVLISSHFPELRGSVTLIHEIEDR
ncbi:MAG: choice-of-anchor L domain-containing protein [Cryomorphaceae bacterium]